jgi:hypothetical protein
MTLSMLILIVPAIQNQEDYRPNFSLEFKPEKESSNASSVYVAARVASQSKLF